MEKPDLHIEEPRELTEYQREHWEQQLKCAEKAVEVALKMLGRTPADEDTQL